MVAAVARKMDTGFFGWRIKNKQAQQIAEKIIPPPAYIQGLKPDFGKWMAANLSRAIKNVRNAIPYSHSNMPDSLDVALFMQICGYGTRLSARAQPFTERNVTLLF